MQHENATSCLNIRCRLSSTDSISDEAFQSNPDPDVLIALPPDELGRRMIPLLAAWPHEGEQLQLVQFLPSRAAGTSHQDYLGYSVDHRRPQIEVAVREAWAWLERQALLIPDTRFDHGVSMLSTNAQQLAKELHSMADGEISEAGRKARFEQWEQLGVDVIRTDLEANRWTSLHRRAADGAQAGPGVGENEGSKSNDCFRCRIRHLQTCHGQLLRAGVGDPLSQGWSPHLGFARFSLAIGATTSRDTRTLFIAS